MNEREANRLISRLRQRSLALYQDVADNADMLPDAPETRETALKRIAEIEQFWPKEGRDEEI